MVLAMTQSVAIRGGIRTHDYTPQKTARSAGGLKPASVRNATQRNATQRNATQRNATQRNATQRNDYADFLVFVKYPVS